MPKGEQPSINSFAEFMSVTAEHGKVVGEVFVDHVDEISKGYEGRWDKYDPEYKPSESGYGDKRLIRTVAQRNILFIPQGADKLHYGDNFPTQFDQLWREVAYGPTGIGSGGGSLATWIDNNNSGDAGARFLTGSGMRLGYAFLRKPAGLETNKDTKTTVISDPDLDVQLDKEQHPRKVTTLKTTVHLFQDWVLRPYPEEGIAREALALAEKREAERLKFNSQPQVHRLVTVIGFDFHQDPGYYLRVPVDRRR